VTYGDAELPQSLDKGWTYDPSRNAIVLGRDIDWESQPQGSAIKVHYDEAKIAGVEKHQ
jgi:hypothetical protein